ncbi:hypothetical protein Tco_0438137 [Tanacetum coccineum]
MFSIAEKIVLGHLLDEFFGLVGSLPLCQSTTPIIDPPVIHDDTSLIPTKTPTISPIASMIPPTAPTTHYTSPFIHTDSSDDDTPDTPPSPTHEIPPVEVAPPTGLNLSKGGHVLDLNEDILKNLLYCSEDQYAYPYNGRYGHVRAPNIHKGPQKE